MDESEQGEEEIELFAVLPFLSATRESKEDSIQPGRIVKTLRDDNERTDSKTDEDVDTDSSEYSPDGDAFDYCQDVVDDQLSDSAEEKDEEEMEGEDLNVTAGDDLFLNQYFSLDKLCEFYGNLNLKPDLLEPDEGVVGSDYNPAEDTFDYSRDLRDDNLYNDDDDDEEADATAEEEEATELTEAGHDGVEREDDEDGDYEVEQDTYDCGQDATGDERDSEVEVEEEDKDAFDYCRDIEDDHCENQDNSEDDMLDID